MANSPGGTEEGRVSIRVVPDVSGFAADLKKSLTPIAESARIEIPVSADTSGIAEHVRLAAEAAQAAAPTININTDVDTDVIQRDLVPALGKVEQSAGRSSQLFGGWGPLIAVAAVAAAAIAPALAVVFPLLAGIGVIVGALALSFKGLKTALQPIADGFKAIQAPITAIVTAGLAPLVAQFTKSFIPAVLPALEAAAGFLNTLVKGFLKLGANTKFLAGFSALLTGAVTALSPLADLVPVIAQAFVDLGTAALPGLAALITGFSNATRQVSASLSALASSGQLQSIITGAVAALQALGSVAAAAFGALLNIGIALAPVLTALATALAPIITQLGTTFAAEITALTPALTQLVAILGPALTQVIAALTPTLVELAAQFSKTLVAILPLLPPIIALAVKILPPLISATTRTTIVLLEVIAAVANAITWFGSFATKLGGAVTGAITAAKTSLQGLITFFKGLPAAAIAAIGDVATLFVSVGSDIIAGIVSGVTGAAGKLASSVKDAAKGALDGVKGFLHIGSPSKLFADEVGKWISLGIAEGVDQHAPAVSSSIISAVGVPDLGSAAGAGSPSGSGAVVHIDQMVVSDPDEATKVMTTRWRDAASVFNLVSIGAVG